MSVSADALRTHLDYTIWASQRLLQAAAQLSDEELNRDFGTADRSVLGALSPRCRPNGPHCTSAGKVGHSASPMKRPRPKSSIEI